MYGVDLVQAFKQKGAIIGLVFLMLAASSVVQSYRLGVLKPLPAQRDIVSESSEKIQPPIIAPFQQRFQTVSGKACPKLHQASCLGYLIRHAGGVCPAQPTCCGNRKCDQGENSFNCPRDCKTVVEPKEGCPKVEQPACIGRLIFALQPAGACPSAPVCCGNGKCEDGEGERSCPDDCANLKVRKEKMYCPEIALPRCTGFLVYPQVPRGACTKAPSCCGDGVCSPIETALECPKDCGVATVEGAPKPFPIKETARYRVGTVGAAFLINKNSTSYLTGLG